MARTASGLAMVWGSNRSGQLGLGCDGVGGWGGDMPWPGHVKTATYVRVLVDAESNLELPGLGRAASNGSMNRSNSRQRSNQRSSQRSKSGLPMSSKSGKPGQSPSSSASSSSSSSSSSSPSSTEGGQHATAPLFVTSVACGASHSLVVSKSGSIYAWGRGKCGRLGTGTTDDQWCPVVVQVRVIDGEALLNGTGLTFLQNDPPNPEMTEPCAMWS